MKILSIIVIFILCSSTCGALQPTPKKLANPAITPMPTYTEASTQESEPAPPIPPAPPAYLTVAEREKAGLLGWGRNADCGSFYIMNHTGQQGLFGLLAARGNIIVDDPWSLGTRINLAEDAVEYKIGLGFALGNGLNNQPIWSIPFFADALIYLKEKSLFGFDPFVGFGLNINLMGTDSTMGGFGSQIYLGILKDFGFKSGQTRFALGLTTIKVSTRTAAGITLAVSQPTIF
ncbi:MAG: hypothetical protein ABH823_03055 [bacterium]